MATTSAYSVSLSPWGAMGFRLNFPFDRDLIERIKLCLGAKWDRGSRAWVSEGPEILLDLERFGVEFRAADAESRRRMDDYRERTERIYLLKKGEQGNEGEPYGFQRVGTEILDAQIRGILADQMGLGKSKQALDAAAKMGANDILVIAEKSLSYKWEAEVKKWYPDWIPFVIPDKPAERNAALKTIALPRKEGAQPRVIIVNYEKIRTQWWPIEKAWDVLIFDEAHKTKNRKSITHERIKAIAQRSIGIFALTGTPLETRPEELFAVMSIVRPSVFGEGITRFRSQHIDEVWDGQRVTYVFRNKDLLRERFAAWLTRRLKSQVQSQIPPKLYTPYVFDLTPGEQSFYRHFAAQAADWLNASDPLVAILRYQQLTSSPYLVGRPDLGRGSKFEALQAVLGDWDSRAIVFTRFRTMAEYLREWLGLPERAIITGQVTDPQERFARLSDFNAGKLGDVFIGTDALSHGLDVAADLVIHYDKLWNPAKEWQREDRCHGIGRGIEGRATNVVHLLAHKTIDEGMHAVTSKRADMIREIVDGADDVLLSRFSLGDFKAMIEGRL